jgi:hypothetical protein
MSNDKMTTASAAETLAPKAVKRLRKDHPRIFGDLLKHDGEHVIAPASDEKTGQWVCADCGEVFQNNLMAHNHRPKSHRRVWWTGTQFESP